MDDATKALVYALRKPARGKKPMKYKDIQKLVTKKDGKTKPSIPALYKAVMTHKIKKNIRGRKKGSRATT